MSTENDGVNTTLETMLKGTQLDTLRVYSMLIQLGFVRVNASDDLPRNVWVSASGRVTLAAMEESDAQSVSDIDFFARRAAALRDLYLLIGGQVSSARATSSGTLEILLGSTVIRAEPEGEGDLEEIWEVTSGMPDPSPRSAWYVCLDSFGTISVRSPVHDS
jgi:hypothetical protein